jgi:hypothetical protein
MTKRIQVDRLNQEILELDDGNGDYSLRWPVVLGARHHEGTLGALDAVLDIACPGFTGEQSIYIGADKFNAQWDNLFAALGTQTIQKRRIIRQRHGRP